MKLFLTSKAVSPAQAQPLRDLVGKQEITIALIENAADVERQKDWLYDNRRAFAAQGFQVDLVDLNEYQQKPEDLQRQLELADVIWLGGGNTYYLRWILRQTGADEVIFDLVGRGKVYGGGSAGAIVAGPTLRFFEAADDPTDAPEVILDGLGLTSTVILPHWGNEKYGPILQAAEKNLHSAGYKTVRITDDEAVAIDGDQLQIIR